MTITTIRVRFTKRGKVRFTGHRDVARIWERAIRRAGLPVAYTEGFTPRPKLSFGLALPTGDESDGEYLDIALVDENMTLPVADLPAVLTTALPDGFDVVAVTTVESSGPSLQEQIASCGWSFEVRGLDRAGAERFARRVLDSEHLPFERIRKGRSTEVDLRPAVLSLAVLGAGERGQMFAAELATRPFSVRPAEVVAAVAPDLEIAICRRTHQWIEGDGRDEPIPSPVDDSHRAEVCAS